MKRLLIGLVKGYQHYISPLTPPSCRYHPTCSHYMVQAIEKHGAIKGTTMGLARIMRCHPFTDGGFDTVPDYFTVKRNLDDLDRQTYERVEAPDEIEQLLTVYHEKLNIRSEAVTLKQAAAELVSLEACPLDKISTEQLAELVSEELGSVSDWELYRVVRDKRSEAYFSQVAPGPLDKVWEPGTVGLLINEERGVYESNSVELLVDVIRQYGVTERDIQERSDRLLEYLYFLRETDVW